MEKKTFRALDYVQAQKSEKDFIEEARNRYTEILARRKYGREDLMGFLSDSLQLTKEQKSRVDHVANMVLSKRRPPTQIPAKLSISEKEGLEKYPS